MDDVFVDASVFVMHCMVGELTLVKLLEAHSLVTSPNVIEEAYYKSLFLKTENVFGKTGKYVLKEKYVKNREPYAKVFGYFNVFIRELVEKGAVRILPLTSEILLDSIEISWQYGLLPNDALIAATCRHYGIRKIATFDDDSRGLIFLRL